MSELTKFSSFKTHHFFYTLNLTSSKYLLKIYCRPWDSSNKYEMCSIQSNGGFYFFKKNVNEEKSSMQDIAILVVRKDILGKWHFSMKDKWVLIKWYGARDGLETWNSSWKVWHMVGLHRSPTFLGRVGNRWHQMSDLNAPHSFSSIKYFKCWFLTLKWSLFIYSYITIQLTK